MPPGPGRAGGDLAGQALWKQNPAAIRRPGHRPHLESRSKRAPGAQTGCLAQRNKGRPGGGDGAASTSTNTWGSLPAIPLVRAPRCGSTLPVIHSAGPGTTASLPDGIGRKIRARKASHYGQAIADAGGLSLQLAGTRAQWPRGLQRTPPAWPRSRRCPWNSQREHRVSRTAPDFAAIQWPGPAWRSRLALTEIFRPSASS